MKTALVVIMLLAVPLMALTTEEAMEESGENGTVCDTPQSGGKTPPSRAQVLLIPDSTTDAVGMYDTNDGTYLGDFIVDDPTGTLYDLQTPINAMEGPGGMIFVSDQISDAVYAFDNEGNFSYTAALTGLNNVRGIDFRDDTLYVTSGDDYVARRFWVMRSTAKTARMPQTGSRHNCGIVPRSCRFALRHPGLRYNWGRTKTTE